MTEFGYSVICQLGSDLNRFHHWPASGRMMAPLNSFKIGNWNALVVHSRRDAKLPRSLLPGDLAGLVTGNAPGSTNAIGRIYQGILNVTDPAAFHRTFTRGIGSAKAFGFGLLVIAPIQ